MAAARLERKENAMAQNARVLRTSFSSSPVAAYKRERVEFNLKEWSNKERQGGSLDECLVGYLARGKELRNLNNASFLSLVSN